jgi:hypothetical protein
MDQAELSWKLEDYERRELDPPDRLLLQPEACEGELMTDAEVEQYITDGMATIMILNDKGSPRLRAVKAAFFADLEFLVSIDRLAVDDYNDITKPENYEF